MNPPFFHTVRTMLRTNSRNYVTYDNTNTVFNARFNDHPIILSGILRPEVIKILGLDPNMKYYIINQVSHKHQDKFHMEMKKTSPNYDLKGDVGTAQYTKGFYIVPESVLLKGINTKEVILHDRGISIQQEELIIKDILNNIKPGDKIPSMIYDPLKQNWISSELNPSWMILFTKEQKLEFFELKTGNIYDSDGNIISQPIIRPVTSLMVIPNEPDYVSASIMAMLANRAEEENRLNKAVSIAVASALLKKANETSNLVNIDDKTSSSLSDDE